MITYKILMVRSGNRAKQFVVVVHVLCDNPPSSLFSAKCQKNQADMYSEKPYQSGSRPINTSNRSVKLGSVSFSDSAHMQMRRPGGKTGLF